MKSCHVMRELKAATCFLWVYSQQPTPAVTLRVWRKNFKWTKKPLWSNKPLCGWTWSVSWDCFFSEQHCSAITAEALKKCLEDGGCSHPKHHLEQISDGNVNICLLSTFSRCPDTMPLFATSPQLSITLGRDIIVLTQVKPSRSDDWWAFPIRQDQWKQKKAVLWRNESVDIRDKMLSACCQALFNAQK